MPYYYFFEWYTNHEKKFAILQATFFFPPCNDENLLIWRKIHQAGNTGCLGMISSYHPFLPSVSFFTNSWSCSLLGFIISQSATWDAFTTSRLSYFKNQWVMFPVKVKMLLLFTFFFLFRIIETNWMLEKKSLFKIFFLFEIIERNWMLVCK